MNKKAIGIWNGGNHMKAFVVVGPKNDPFFRDNGKYDNKCKEYQNPRKRIWGLQRMCFKQSNKNREDI